MDKVHEEINRMATMVDESESSSPQSTPKNNNNKDEEVQSSSGGEEEEASIAVKIAEDVEKGIKGVDEARLDEAVAVDEKSQELQQMHSQAVTQAQGDEPEDHYEKYPPSVENDDPPTAENKDAEEKAKEAEQAWMDEAMARGMQTALAEKERPPPLPQEARGHEALTEKSQELQQMHSQAVTQAQGDEPEDHFDESPSTPASDDIASAENAPTTTRPRSRVGAFRMFPSVRTEHPVSREDNDDDDWEVGGTNNTNDEGDAAVVSILDAYSVHDRAVEAHPIHSAHFSISGVHPQPADNEDKNDSFQSGRKIVFKRLAWGILFVCVTVAVAMGVYLGTKDKDKDKNKNNTTGSDFSEQSKDEEVPTNTTIFAPTKADDISPIIWEQVGSDIPGANIKNRAGWVVATSNDGKIIAIGSPYNDDVATQAGHARIFAWNYSANDWTQRGSTLLGEAKMDRFGFSVALSGSGDTVVCGAPLHDEDDSGQVKVFKWNETLNDYVLWGSLHNQITYKTKLWGWGVDISQDGLRIAVGAPGPEESHASAMVFQWNENIMDWSPMGNGLIGEQVGDNFGHSISLSADGETLAVGAIYHNGTSGVAGKTHMLKWDDGVSDWVQLGSGIYGEAAGDSSGWSTDLSADGKTLAISALTNVGVNGEESGHVRVYFWDESKSDWAQMGSDIDGKNQFDRFGMQVSLADDGKTIAITSTLNADSGKWSGHCRVFQWSDSLQDWIQAGQDIQGEVDDRTRGVALSGNGRTVVVGAWGALERTGYVRVFNSSQWKGDEHE